jgi:hypothetical protein
MDSPDRRPDGLKQIFQGLFLLAQRKGATTASVGIHGTAFAVSDNGPGWTERSFRKEFPSYDLGRRLHEVGCAEVQVVSRSRRGGWTTGRLPPMQLTPQTRLNQVSLPVTGTTIAFDLTDPVDQPEQLVQLARGVIPLSVRLDRQEMPRLHEAPQAWFRIRTTNPAGEFALNDALPGRTTVDGRGLYRPLHGDFPRSVFVPEHAGEASFEQGMRAASLALQARLARELQRRAVVAPQEMAPLIRRCGGDYEKQNPTRLVEFGLLLGYAAAITTSWTVSRGGVARGDYQLARLSRKTAAVEDLGKESAAILGAAGFDVTTSELAPEGAARSPLRLTSLDGMPWLFQTLEAYSGDTVGVQALPCKSISAGRLRLPWVVLTPQTRCFQADGEDLGDGAVAFLAIDAHDIPQLRRLLWTSPELLSAFAWLMTTWEDKRLDWCLYRAGEDEWCLNPHRVRVVLYDTLSAVARWDDAEKAFAGSARDLEEQLDPALSRLTASAPSLQGALRGPLLSLEPHIAELENERSRMWNPSA